ncbi:carcinoembryonic antigen-related cell adhesion molecule 21-like [Myotis daubentonii]|uniref:carcinoembryonic antigen-related cell adhesion molecule 21-like n=1 Tax=Myotis daubentonii TaxID=98922 RepID=UPI0028730BAA|nr:carcinoembryonic antigen-related cell adhesion molecule 21-like [Myotis daubentonii]
MDQAAVPLEFPAASAHRGRVPWLELLLAGYYSVYLTGTEYIGRADINLDGSLIIRNVTVWDEGIYMVVAVLPNSRREVGFGWLKVYRQVRVPTLLASNTTVTENEDAVVMTCHTHGSSPKWLFNSKTLRLKERMKLTKDRRTLTIDPVRREDAGSYQCKVSNPFSSAEIFLLTFWIPATTARFAIASTSAVEGQDVILHLRNTPPNVKGFIWYRGIETKYYNLIGTLAWQFSRYLTGPEYSGREKINLDGSLIIRNVTVQDLGIYVVAAVLPKSRRVIGFGRLNVYRPLSVPTLLASNTTVTENEDSVVMTCHTDESSINWLFNAMSLRLRERMKLSEDHRTLTIEPVMREDAGNYQCKVSNPVSSTESAPVELDVKY